MFKNEVLEAIDIFNEFSITKDRQRKIFNKGIYFDFTYGDPDPYNKNRKLGVLEIAMLLKICKFYNIQIDANNIIDHPYDFNYINIVDMVCEIKNNDKNKIKRLGDENG